MKHSRWMWRVAVACFVSAPALAWAQQADAIPQSGFTWSQVVFLGGIAAAWGDMRRRVIRLEEHTYNKKHGGR